MDQRKTLAVMFGGRSVEHEISIITALELISAVDVLKFKVVPVYIASDGRWFTGTKLLERQLYRGLPGSLSALDEVTLLAKPGSRGLTVLKKGGAAPGMKSMRALTSRLTGPEVIPIDVWAPVFHGQFGEDGCIQGLLELADVPYTSSDLLPSAVAMNKYLCKVAVNRHGVPVLPAAVVQKDRFFGPTEPLIAEIRNTPGLEKFPLFIKPCNLGSSIGIGRAQNESELLAALAKVFRFDTQALVEPCVTNMLEINISVIDGPNSAEPRPSVVETPVSQSGTLTYEEKYMRGGKSSKGKTGQAQGMASLLRKIDPPDLPANYKQQVTAFAVIAYQVLGCSGVVRFDFILDLDSGNAYFNELNPLPGAFSHYLWVKSKPRLLYTELVTHIVESAIRRKTLKGTLERDVGFRALFR